VVNGGTLENEQHAQQAETHYQPHPFSFFHVALRGNIIDAKKKCQYSRNFLYFFKMEPEQPADKNQQQAEYLVPGRATGPSCVAGTMVAQELQKKADQAVGDQIKTEYFTREAAPAVQQAEGEEEDENQSCFVELDGMEGDAGEGMWRLTEEFK
jgi:hypothetical protein